MGKDRKDRKEEGRALTAGTDLDKYTHPHTHLQVETQVACERKATLISKKRVSAQSMLRKDMMGVIDTFPFRISHS